MDFNVLSYFAVGDGTTDDTSAFNNAISALNSVGAGVLVIPSTSAYYKIAGNLASITAKAWVRGDSVATSKLVFSGGPGIVFDRTAANIGLCRITDIWLLQSVAVPSPDVYGISYLGGTPGNNLDQQFWCERCQIYGGWKYGLRYSSTGGNRSVIRDVNIYGNAGNITQMDRGFQLYGPGGNVALDNCQVQWANTAYVIEGTSLAFNEGTVLRGCTGAAVNAGVYATSETANNQLYDCFFNANYTAINLNASSQNDIKNLYLLWGSNNSAGVLMDGNYNTLQNSRLFGVGSTATVAVQLEGILNKVSGCILGNAGVGLLFGNTTGTCSARDLTFNSCSTNTVDNGSNNSITDVLF